MPTQSELRRDLAELPPGERAELALYLIDSLEGDGDADAASLWAAELTRRAGEILAGTATGEDARVVMDRLRRQHS
jgi:hypothetical protein